MVKCTLCRIGLYKAWTGAVCLGWRWPQKGAPRLSCNCILILRCHPLIISRSCTLTFAVLREWGPGPTFLAFLIFSSFCSFCLILAALYYRFSQWLTVSWPLWIFLALAVAANHEHWQHAMWPRRVAAKMARVINKHRYVADVVTHDNFLLFAGNDQDGQIARTFFHCGHVVLLTLEIA